MYWVEGKFPFGYAGGSGLVGVNVCFLYLLFVIFSKFIFVEIIGILSNEKKYEKAFVELI